MSMKSESHVFPDVMNQGSNFLSQGGITCGCFDGSVLKKVSD